MVEIEGVEPLATLASTDSAFRFPLEHYHGLDARCSDAELYPHYMVFPTGLEPATFTLGPCSLSFKLREDELFRVFLLKQM